MSKQYYVYMITNWNHRVLYIGVTNNLERRIFQHKTKQNESFTKKYNVSKLVYFEITSDIYSAISREKQLKGWSRAKKDELIYSSNPQWKSLL